MSDGPAAYSLYDLLRVLIDRVGWPDEDQKRAAVRSVGEAERMNILGNLARDMVCEHPTEARSAGQCRDCGRQVENTADPSGWRDRYRDPAPEYRYGAGSGRGW